jgi:uncharacterized protein YndB with AHSA1/START domain
VKRWIVALLVVAAIVGLALAPVPIDDTTRIRNSVSIDRNPDVVFAYVTTPANWPKWHPSSLAVSGATDHPLDLGEQVTEDFLVAGRRGRVVWTVVEREAPERWVIAGEVGGRPTGAVTYTLESAGAGTRFDRELVYASPTLLFAVLNRLGIRATVERESAEAVRRLKAVLEAGPTSAVRSGKSGEPSGLGGGPRTRVPAWVRLKAGRARMPRSGYGETMVTQLTWTEWVLSLGAARGADRVVHPRCQRVGALR